MEQWKERTSLLFGEDKMKRLSAAHVLIVGVGGVGSYTAELLCRAGVGRLTLVDGDTIQPSNINRQLPALHSTVGREKVEVVGERLKQINPDVELNLLPLFIKDEAIAELFDRAKYDFVVDAIDTLSPKCFLIIEAFKRDIPIVSSMGAGAKSDITQVGFNDIWKCVNCKLSRAVRKRLFKIMGERKKLPVVYSKEMPNPEAIILIENEQNKKSTCGTVSYMPAVFGCFLAEYVIKQI